MNPPNPNDSAYNRETFNQSRLAHERFLARFGPQSQPSRPMLPLKGKLVVSRVEDGWTFYKFEEGESHG